MRQVVVVEVDVDGRRCFSTFEVGGNMWLVLAPIAHHYRNNSREGALPADSKDDGVCLDWQGEAKVGSGGFSAWSRFDYCPISLELW